MPPWQDTLEFAAAVLELPRVMETPAIPHDSDAALVAASQQGDTDAFGQLYQRYVRLVHGVLLARVRSTEVEDLVQDVFLRALPRLRDLRDASRSAPARHHCAEYRYGPPPSCANATGESHRLGGPRRTTDEIQLFRDQQRSR